MTDIKLTEIKNLEGDNYFDISFTDGDFTLTEGLDTAIQMSVLCEQRLEDQEVIPSQRGGWLGNQLQQILGYQQGSLIWTKYQSNMNAENQSVLEGYLNDAFQWMIDDGIVKNVEVQVNLLANSKVTATIVLTQNDNTETATSFDLWKFTGA